MSNVAAKRATEANTFAQTYAAAKESVLNSIYIKNSWVLNAVVSKLLVITLMGSHLSAQTQVTAGQLPALQGAVQGTTSSTTLRDFNSVLDHGSSLSSGIAGAISACGTTTSCSIIIPPSYTTAEQVPGYYLDPNNPLSTANTPGNISIFDQRYGDARMAVNPRGYQDGLISSPNGWVYNYYARQPVLGIISPLFILQNSFDGGTNGQSSDLGYVDKTTYTPLTLTNYSHTPGQHLGLGVTTKNYSNGDALGIANYLYCWGGINAQADEGCEAQDNQVFMGNVAFEGTVTGNPNPGGTSLTVSPTQGRNTQGAGRFLIRLNAGTLTAGSISAVNSPGNTLTTINGNGTSWPVSSMIGQLGSNVSAPGAATVSPATFTVGSMSQITTSTLVCVADGNAFEMVYPSAVTSSTFTATFTKVHPAAATIAAGGVCGYLFDLTADDVTNATYPNKIETITGTLRFAWPAVASTGSGSLLLYVAGAGSYQQLTTRWDAAAASGYVLYPMAEVVSVQQGGGLSNTFTLGPNNVAWTAGDTVEQPVYPAQHISFGSTTVESYYPNTVAGAGGFSLNYNMPLQGSDTMLGLVNNAPASMYRANGGKYTPPVGIHISGETGYGLMFDTPSDQWTLGVGCASPCNSVANVLAAANGSAYDFVQYDQGNKRWVLTANSSSALYTFGSNQMLTPFANVSLASDNSGVGYVATQSLRSGTVNNTDLTGELVFSSATAMTYIFAGSYGAHNECWAEPQFDPGSGNRHWITYSGTASMTINFATAVSGSVSYGCVGRN